MRTGTALKGEYKLVEGTDDPQTRFERPKYTRLVLHTLCCAAIYPFLYFITWIAQGRSLFVVRSLVSSGITVVSFIMGIFLLEYAKRIVAAATWTTLIQPDEAHATNRMTLNELTALSGDPNSVLSAWRLMRVRGRIHRSMGDESRRIWFAYLLFFPAMVGIAGVLSFALGRVVDIVAQDTFDFTSFEEVPVFGDLTEDDVSAYLPVKFWEDPLGWLDDEPDLDENTSRDIVWNNIPPAWKYNNPSYTTAEVANQTIYFTDPYAAQLRPDGTALGANRAESNSGLLTTLRSMAVGDGDSVDPTQTSLLQFPQWGVKVVCEKLPDPTANLKPKVNDSVNDTVVELPLAFVSGLYSSLNLTLPEDEIRGKQPSYHHMFSEQLDFITAVGSGPEFWPDASNDSSILTTVVFLWDQDDLQGRRVAGYLTDYGDSGNGWTVFDVFLMRLDNVRSPYEVDGFPVSFPYPGGTYGYDVIACVQHTEPWMIEVYNSTGVVRATRILGNGVALNDIDSVGVDGGPKPKQATRLGADVVRKLNSTGKIDAYFGAYSSSTYAWLEQAGTGAYTTQLDVSWTDGTGYQNFTTLSASLFQTFRGVSAATTILPLLAGSQQIAARRFEGRQAAFAHILPIPMAMAVTLLFLAGVVGCLCIPSLPSKVPYRGFDAASWMAAIKGDGLDLDTGARGDERWSSRMSMETVEKQFGSHGIKYHVE